MIELLPINMVATGITWVLVATTASFFASLVYPLYKKSLDRAAPSSQAFGLMIYGILPLVAAFLVTFLLNYPHLASSLIPDHCHGQNCDPHRPEISLRTHGGAALIALFAAALFSVIVIIQRKLAATRLRLKALHQLSRESGNISYRTIDSPKLLAWCTGLIKPRIYLSTGLVATLNSRQLEAVLIHESIHATRRDNLRKAVVGFATLLWPRLLRTGFLADFTAATEKTCDSLTAVKLKDSALVSAVIGMLASVHHGNNEVSQDRLDSLKAHPQRQEPGAITKDVAITAWLIITSLWVANIVVLTGIAHLAVEWAIR